MLNEQSVALKVVGNESKNLSAIERAFNEGRMDAEARDCLVRLYSDSMNRLRDMFYILGQCFGAPKTAVFSYDSATCRADEFPIGIKDINPTGSYME
jgi:hypothetical protein